MNDQALAMATRFREVHDEVIQCAEGCTPDDWRRMVPHEGRSIAYLFNHIADAYVVETQALVAFVTGQSGPAYTREDLNAWNAAKWEENPYPEQALTIARLRAEAERTATATATLTEPQLALSAKYGTLPEMTVAEFVERLVIGHPGMHLPGMQRELGMSSHG